MNVIALERDPTFGGHQLRRVSPHLWRVANPSSSNCWFEVTSIVCGTHLVVAGDIDVVVFGRHSPQQASLEDLVRWMGRGGIDYVAEKAAIGMGAHELVYEIKLPALLEDLAQIPADSAEPSILEYQRKLAAGDLWHYEDAEELRRAMYSDGVDSETLAFLGKRVTQRVLTAHAGLKHLVKLLDGEAL